MCTSGEFGRAGRVTGEECAISMDARGIQAWWEKTQHEHCSTLTCTTFAGKNLDVGHFQLNHPKESAVAAHYSLCRGPGFVSG